MGQYVDFYCGNENKELKKIVNPILKNKFTWLQQKDYDDFYSIASMVVWDCEKKFDDNKVKTKKFKSFLSTCIHNKIKTRITHINRDKRMAKDEEGNPLHNSSLDTPVGDDDNLTIGDYLSDNCDVEKEVIKRNCNDENVKAFLESLSNTQRKIIELKMEDYEPDEIKQMLNISNGEYNAAMKSIQMNENLSLFTKNINDCNHKEEAHMERVMEINEADNWRTDKHSMFSLLEDKKSGDINCKYILQRKPFQWTQEERNRYICRILSNLPIPEIILCEQNLKGLLISHLIDGLQRLSYAEAFKENRFKISANGSERHLIKYREFIMDEDGNRVLDEDGIPLYEEKICDVVGKYYKDLPDELRKRFNNFNINVTKFFNCTDEQIADHIRDYNNHSSMNNEQSGLTKISTDTARKIKTISEKNTFFKNCGKFTDITATKGKLDKIVSESIMLLFHRNEWKSKIDKAYQFIDENSKDEEFFELNSDLNRLELALGEDNKEIKQMFTVASTPMWIAVFHEFTSYGMEDSRFVEFMSAYKNELCKKEIDGISMENFKDMQSKKKATITGKIDLLVKLMKEFLHIDEIKEVTTEEFLSEVVDVPMEIIEEEINVYEEDLKGLKNNTIRDGSRLLEDANNLSLLAMVAYAYKNDITLDYWLEEFASNNNTYNKNQKQNYLYMVKDLKQYLQKGAVA